MPLFKRPDGTLSKKLPAFRRLNPYLMKTRVESTIFIPLHIDVTHTIDYLKTLSEKYGRKISIFNVILCAAARTFALRPEINRFCVGTKLYQRNEIVFSFVAKKQMKDKGKETNVKMSFSPFVTLDDVIERLYNELNRAKGDEEYDSDKEVEFYGKIPGFLLRFLIWIFKVLDKHNLAPNSMLKSDPLYCSAFITNMGSVGMELGPHHHLFEWGNASLFLSISKYTKRPVVDENNNIVIRDIMDLIVSWDDRIADGFYGQRSAELMKDLIEHPEKLEKPPEISDEILSELMLKDFPPSTQK